MFKFSLIIVITFHLSAEGEWTTETAEVDKEADSSNNSNNTEEVTKFVYDRFSTSLCWSLIYWFSHVEKRLFAETSTVEFLFNIWQKLKATWLNKLFHLSSLFTTIRFWKNIFVAFSICIVSFFTLWCICKSNWLWALFLISSWNSPSSHFSITSNTQICGRYIWFFHSCVSWTWANLRTNRFINNLLVCLR